MAYVLYEELPGSPALTMDRRGGSAERSVVLAGQDIQAFYLELFPNPYYGFLGSAPFPGVPWLRAEKVKFTPFQSDKQIILDDGAGNAVYALIQADVSYTWLGEDSGHQGGPLGDHSGPGGAPGSTGGHQGSDQAYVQHKVTVGGEFLVTKGEYFRWAWSGNRDTSHGPVDQYKAPADLPLGITNYTISHSITWDNVFWPPWAAIRQCANKVNAYAIAGAPRGTLLFHGVEATIKQTVQGTHGWTLEYKFDEKNYNPADPTHPKGWNWFNRPDGDAAGTWQPLLRKIPPKKLRDTGKFGIPKANLLNAVGSADSGFSLDAAGTAGDPADFPNQLGTGGQGQFLATIEPSTPNAEVVAVVAGGSTVGWTVLRGVDGTAAVPHAAGSVLKQRAGGPFDLADFRFLFLPGIPL